MRFELTRKRRFTFDLLATLFFTAGSVIKLLEYLQPGGEGMDLFGTIILGILAVFKAVDLAGHFKRERSAGNR